MSFYLFWKHTWRPLPGGSKYAAIFAQILRLNSACEGENRQSSPSLERRVRVTGKPEVIVASVGFGTDKRASLYFSAHTHGRRWNLFTFDWKCDGGSDDEGGKKKCRLLLSEDRALSIGSSDGVSDLHTTGIRRFNNSARRLEWRAQASWHPDP